MDRTLLLPYVSLLQILSIDGAPIYPEIEQDTLHSKELFFEGGRVAELKLQEEKKGKPPVLEGYKEGPHPLISDSLFSLIIFIYVSVTFLYMFYGFCWREPEREKPVEKEEEEELGAGA